MNEKGKKEDTMCRTHPLLGAGPLLLLLQALHLYNEVELAKLVGIVPGGVGGGHEHLLLGHLALHRLHGATHHSLELRARLLPLRVEQGDLVGVLGRHTVRPDVLYVGNHQLTVVRPPHRRGVDVLHHEPEQVTVPLVDKGPDVPLVELLCSATRHYLDCCSNNFGRVIP